MPNFSKKSVRELAWLHSKTVRTRLKKQGETIVEFQLTPAICVHVRGESRGEGFAREDKGMVSKLFAFLDKEGIYPILRVGHSGAGSYMHFFEEHQAELIRDWLVTHGCVEGFEEEG